MALARRQAILLPMAVALGAGLLTGPAGQPARTMLATSLASPARSDPSSITNVLTGVSAVSASDAWAVGYYVSNGGPGPLNNTLILHWDGTSWSQVSSPDPGNNNYLEGVSAVSASDVWAVGCTFTNGVGQTMILHWDGTAWSRVTSPSPKADQPCLYGVSADSGTDAWAAGTENPNAIGPSPTLLLHWNGTTWSRVSSPGVHLGQNPGFAVSAVSASDAWAVRDSYNPTTKVTRTFILRWNGTTWSRVTSPNPSPAANTLASVTVISATNAWAAGDYYNSATKATGTLILHWNGTTWSKVTSPSPSGSESLLAGVTAASGSNAWAVGSYVGSTGATDTLVLRWNGTTWSKTPSPDLGATINELRGVSIVSPTDAWAVGVYHDNTANTTHTLILHWDGRTWSVSPH